jgi:hypothetical protein
MWISVSLSKSVRVAGEKMRESKHINRVLASQLLYTHTEKKSASQNLFKGMEIIMRKAMKYSSNIGWKLPRP